MMFCISSKALIRLKQSFLKVTKTSGQKSLKSSSVNGVIGVNVIDKGRMMVRVVSVKQQLNCHWPMLQLFCR
jgi:hypothetical protein